MTTFKLNVPMVYVSNIKVIEAQSLSFYILCSNLIVKESDTVPSKGRDEIIHPWYKFFVSYFKNIRGIVPLLW